MPTLYKTKREKVYFELQKEIINGVIRPGERLITSNLAKRFNVSEIPVREALQKLTHEGYVTLTPHSGVTVSIMSEDDIRQIFEIRINLEGLATRLAVDHLSNAHIKTLEEMVDKSTIHFENEDLEAYGVFNRRFHEYIYQHSNNQRLMMSISELTDFSARYPAFFNSLLDVEVSIREHKEIVDALKDKDAELVEKLMKDHTEAAYHQIIRLVRKANAQERLLTHDS
jgi:DNA-binding GntR family transcriptional regulator